MGPGLLDKRATKIGIGASDTGDQSRVWALWFSVGGNLPRHAGHALPSSGRGRRSSILTWRYLRPWFFSVAVEPGSRCIEGGGGGGAVVSGGFASTFTRPSEAWAQAVKVRAQGVIPRSSALTQGEVCRKFLEHIRRLIANPLGGVAEKLSRNGLLLAG